MTLIDLAKQLAECRFYITIDKARREPYKLIDRISSNTVAKFSTVEDLESFRRDHCDRFVTRILSEYEQVSSNETITAANAARVLHEYDPSSSVSVDADGPSLPNMQGEALASVR